MFILYQFLKRPVWRKISIWKINFNVIIQKSKLRRNRQDEIAFLLFSSFQPGKAKATERYHLLKILAKRRFFSGTKRKPQMEVSLFKDQRFFSLANFWMALCFIIKLLLQLGNILSSHTKTPHVTQPLNSVNPSSSFNRTVSQFALL